MTTYEKNIEVMKKLFSKDTVFAMATVKDNVPSIRNIDAYYHDGAFYIVTYAKSQKVTELEQNPNISLCQNLFRFSGKAFNIGHPLKPENSAIRDILIKAFEPWYFAHNNEGDENMCYVKFEPESGFFFADGTGYKADFLAKTVETFPFENYIG